LESQPPSVNALVVFYCRYGEVERRALAAGVGAIQARANIRLRRLPDLAGPASIDADPAWRDNLERMKKDYIAPRDIDAEWADVVILAAPGDRLAEMEGYLTLAQALLNGKLAAVLGPFADAARRAGLIVVPDEETDPTAYGRRAAEAARARVAKLRGGIGRKLAQ